MIALLSIFVLTIGFGLGWLTVLNNITRPRDANWTGKIYAIKDAAAASVETPKIVVIGGSSVHFGFFAADVHDVTGWPSINLGSHAGLGADYILQHAERALKPGDVAVISLEYGLLSRWWRPTQELSRHVAYNDLRYLLKAPVQDLPLILFGVSPVLVVQDFLRDLRPNGSLYDAGTVASNGDETAHSTKVITPAMRLAVRIAPLVAPGHLGPEDRLWALRNFSAWAREHEVRVFFAWPPLVEKPEYSTGTMETGFEAYADAYRENGIEVLGSYRDAILPPELMLDTGFHPNMDGAGRITHTMARHLCEHITCRIVGVRGSRDFR